MSLTIRVAQPKDVPSMMRLVRELADFEKLPQEVKLTETKMLEDGFGPQPAFHAIVAELDGNVIGMAVYYFSYSTWKGRSIYIDDIIVTETYRGNGVGKELMDEMVRIAIREQAGKLHWQVLDWNEPAIRFYRKYQPSFDGEWVNVALNATQLQAISTVSKIV